MPDLPHLPLQRIEQEMPRRKTGFGSAPGRAYSTHGRKLSQQLDGVIQDFRSRRPPAGVNPNLILRINLNEKSAIDEETWERCGLTLLSVDEDKTLVLFASDADLTDFRGRMNAYTGGPPAKQKYAPHNQIFANIDNVGNIRPKDRIGRLFRQQDITTPEDFTLDREFIVDVELWDLGSRDLCRTKVEEISAFTDSQGGRTTDTYLGESLILMRMRCSGKTVRALLGIDAVALVDLPPTPSLAISQMLDLGFEDFGQTPPPPEDAPTIAVLDSGVVPGHPFLASTIGEATAIPNSLGDPIDSHGHGTRVCGLAVYGDVEKCITNRRFEPELRLLSARVLNDQCEFDDEKLITSQMTDAIRYLRDTYGCRVFNVSLGDDRLPYRGGKVSPWAAILDTLSRELDVVIVVSAGNYQYEPSNGNSPDSHVQDYPSYLFADGAKVIEPATGAIVLTVGALAHSANIPPGMAARSVAFKAIAQPDEPAPFTRMGPGIGGAIKPELCEYGGNRVYDGQLKILRDVRECSIVSFHHEYLQRLFATDNGTSYAAPRVAHMAARLIGAFPEASANLIRAFLASSATVPRATEELLANTPKDALLMICGYGRPDLDMARLSGENRVVLFADSTIAFDNFHIYEVPIPQEFLSTNGQRSISVTLAFDPPVRHSRFDYLGVKMSFRLIRGSSVDDIVEAFRQRTKEEGPFERLTSTSNCNLRPGPQKREPGTLQRATFTMKNNPTMDYGNTYYLVVRCEQKWAGEDYGPQRYAAVVAVQHTQEINIYNLIRQRVQARARIQR
jgi:hypothetical protein